MQNPNLKNTLTSIWIKVRENLTPNKERVLRALSLAVIVAIILWMAMRGYQIVCPTSIKVDGSVIGLVNLLFYWSLGFLALAISLILLDYVKYRRVYRTEEDGRKPQGGRVWGKIRPYIQSIIWFFIDWFAYLKAWIWALHEGLQRYMTYWKIMETSFKISKVYGRFHLINIQRASRLRAVVAESVYHWPKIIGVVIMVTERFTLEQFSYTRSYLGILFFFYLGGKVSKFLGKRISALVWAHVV
jgi:hypothetical protein